MATRIILLLTVVLIAAGLLAKPPSLTGRECDWRHKRGGYIWQGYKRGCGWECGAIAGLGAAARVGGLYRYPYYSSR